MKTILFVQGGGPGAYAADSKLVEQLRCELGVGYSVLYPRLSKEKDPDLGRWNRELILSLTGRRNVTLVGHSLGGATLLNLLTRHKIRRRFAGLYLLAAPAKDSGSWDFENLQMPTNAEKHLHNTTSVNFYHCRDDNIVPSAHMKLHKKSFPNANFRLFAQGGHQFAGHMQDIAADIGGG